jgi:GTP diphosphokinase / guanosine-3',5'-bis(diphosphate) 3'-diphosphatase
MSIKERLLAKVSAILDGPMSLDKAILVAVIAHAGQEDKGGNSYIRHPLRVMEGMDAEDEMAVAVCHDVVEDTDISLEDLSSLGFTKQQRRSIDALTKRPGETYTESIDRVLLDVVARKAKTKDIRDNSQLWRLKSKRLTQKDMERQQNYIDALVKLGEIDKK